ncbi:CD209 antigen-like protein D [Acipenser ruthenus]|uniref:CD209 antigen-like protein D n=1 Tax=Acipenser ruthenus TaxID=7906 RepID=UPI0027403C1E|nr:CD209 antigen-like protein D [Acipenser ruthenus]
MIGAVSSMADDVYGNSDFHQQTGQRKHQDRERYQAPDHNVCGTKSIVFLYVLLIASSVMWAALLSLLFVKCTAEIQTLKTLLTEKDSQIVANFENYISKDSQIIENVTKLEKYVYKVCANTCSGSWNLFNGAFYYFSKEKKGWKEARTFCQSQNSDLAVINSDEELKYLQDKGPAKELWLGLSDSDNEGTWKWLDGRVVEKRLWHKGEPNNYENSEDCGLLSSGLLNDLTCEAKLPWICEKRL